MKCFYHKADLDGLCSGAIVKYRYPDCEMLPIDYGDLFPWDLIDKDDDVWMIDFCLQPFDQMISLDHRCKFIWIDHHSSAIEESKKANYIILGSQDTKYAACELVYHFIYPAKNQIPKAITLLGRFDRFDLDEEVLHFQYGMKIKEPKELIPGSELWSKLFRNGVSLESIRREGAIAYKAIMSIFRNFVRNNSFEFKIGDLRVIGCNIGGTNSLAFEEVYNHRLYDLGMWYFRKGNGFYSATLFTGNDNINCGEICKILGGGGHRNIGGFQTNDIEGFIRGSYLIKIPQGV
jgi:oligoribonuclease NrnB/cAMP/cGMP phosphodiesterase (DHH superfamily)